jgi:hypothetical protein
MMTRSSPLVEERPPESTILRPKKPIRRFDVFAEFSRLKSLEQGYSPAEAKGYALWLAKVVASRRYGAPRARTAPPAEAPAGARPPRDVPGPFRWLGDELQTDELFDREIIDRMGRDFYDRVFSPTIRRRFEEGETYESMRDDVRRDWNPRP